MNSIQVSHDKHQLEYFKANEAYQSSQASLQTNTIDYPQMEKAYQFYQQCRAYLSSYLECYNEKVISLQSFNQSILLSLPDDYFQ